MQVSYVQTRQDRASTSAARCTRVAPAPLARGTRETQLKPARDALAGSLARVVRERAAPRLLQRQLMTSSEFRKRRIADVTLRTLLLHDPVYKAIYLALADYDRVRLAVSPAAGVRLQAAQRLSALCRQWLAAHPANGWLFAVPGGALTAGAIGDMRTVVQEIHRELQQELVDIVTATLGGTYSSYCERTVTAGSVQTPPQAKREGKGRGRGQSHWEGWKLHVSLPPERAGDAVAHIVPVLEQTGCWYKVRKRIDEYRAATDASVGKFIVIYPRSIQHLEQLVTWLEAALPALTGRLPAPRVPGDVQLDRSGYVWARYGVFLDTAASSGRHVRLWNGRSNVSQYAVWDRARNGWVEDPRDAPVPEAWAYELRAQLRAIRFAQTAAAAGMEVSRPRAATL